MTAATGADPLLAAQLAACREDGYEVAAVSRPGPLLDAVEAVGVRPVPVPAAGPGRTHLDAARQLTRALSELRPDIVHTHDPHPGLVGRAIGRPRRRPIVVNTVHGLVAPRADSLSRRVAGYAAHTLTMRLSDMELVENLEDLRRLRRFGAPRARLLHVGSGIDLDRFAASTATRARGLRLRRRLGLAPDAFVVGIEAGRLGPQGHGRLLETVVDLRRAGHADIEFVVVGGPEPAEIATTAGPAVPALATGIHMIDGTTEFENALAAMDLFVVVDSGDGLPRAAMEAQAMGLPVITEDSRWSGQVVVDGMTGLVVPAGRPRAVARSIAQLRDAPATRRAMASAATRRAHRHFDQNRVIDLTLGVYRNQLRAAGVIGARPDPIINLRDHPTISLRDPAESSAPGPTIERSETPTLSL